MILAGKDGGSVEVDGKKGVWRTVRGHRIFFPDDGSAPTGMPKAMKENSKKGPRKAASSGEAEPEPETQ